MLQYSAIVQHETTLLPVVVGIDVINRLVYSSKSSGHRQKSCFIGNRAI